MKKGCIIGIMMLLLVSGASAIGMPLARIDEISSPGDYIDIVVVGSTDESLDNVHISTIIPELYLWEVDKYKSVSKNRHFSKRFVMYIPTWVEPGLYDIKIVISDGHERRVKYRTLEVI